MLSGLSNREFGSTFRKITFPFSDKQEQASLEIYHVAHGKYETNSPIRTFTTAELNRKKYLVASYTCTPLVLFPLDELKAGKHVKGRTIREFGAGNSFLFMANSNRPVMRINYKNIDALPYTRQPSCGATQTHIVDDRHLADSLILCYRELVGTLVINY